MKSLTVIVILFGLNVISKKDWLRIHSLTIQIQHLIQKRLILLFNFTSTLPQKLSLNSSKAWFFFLGNHS